LSNTTKSTCTPFIYLKSRIQFIGLKSRIQFIDLKSRIQFIGMKSRIQFTYLKFIIQSICMKSRIQFICLKFIIQFIGLKSRIKFVGLKSRISVICLISRIQLIGLKSRIQLIDLKPRIQFIILKYRIQFSKLFCWVKDRFSCIVWVVTLKKTDENRISVFKNLSEILTLCFHHYWNKMTALVIYATYSSPVGGGGRLKARGHDNKAVSRNQVLFVRYLNLVFYNFVTNNIYPTILRRHSKIWGRWVCGRTLILLRAVCQNNILHHLSTFNLPDSLILNVFE
jgi:hypothetical protein